MKPGVVIPYWLCLALFRLKRLILRISTSVAINWPSPAGDISKDVLGGPIMYTNTLKDYFILIKMLM